MVPLAQSAVRQASRNPTARGREACRCRRKRNSGFLANARSPRFRSHGCNRHCSGSVGVAGRSGGRRHHMDDAIAARLQFMSGSAAMRRRFAPGCRGATECLFPWPRAAHREVVHPRGRNMPPVVRRKIGAPDLNALRGQIVLDSVGAQQAGDTKERGKCGVSVVPKGRLHRCNPVVDLLLGAFDRHVVHAERMILGVGADGMAGVAELADAFRIGPGPCARW